MTRIIFKRGCALLFSSLFCYCTHDSASKNEYQEDSWNPKSHSRLVAENLYLYTRVGFLCIGNVSVIRNHFKMFL